MANLPRYLSYVRRQGASFPLIFLLTIGVALLGVLQPWPLKLIVDHLLKGQAWPPALVPVLESVSLRDNIPGLLVVLVAGGFALFVLGALADMVLTRLWTKAGHRMVYQLAQDLFSRLQQRSLQFHKRTPVGDLISRITNDCWCVYKWVDALFFAPLHAVLMVGIMVLLMFTLDPVLTGITVVTAPVVVLGSMIIGRPLRQAARERREIESSMQSHVQQTLTGIPLVQGFNREEREQHRFEQFASAAIRAQQRSTLWGSLNQLSSGFLAALGTGVVLWVGANRVLAESLTLGGLLVFLAYLAMLQAQVKVFAGLFTEYQGIMASVQRVNELMDADPELPVHPEARPLVAVEGGIQFEHATFGYEPGRTVLKDVSLDILPGQSVAIVGPSGAGKTTLVGLVPRFFDAWEGSVRVAGRDVREWTLESLRRQVSVLFQEPFLFPWSVMENIRYGRPDASEAAVIEAAKAANADAFIRALPEGYNTVLSERGAMLSGGERQRLAIARAFLKDAPILILDEPTSALDAATEAEVVAAMKRLMADRTTLLIAHRLSTVRWADRIVVLESGRVLETGTHASLLQSEGLYARYVKLQQDPDAPLRASG